MKYGKLVTKTLLHLAIYIVITVLIMVGSVLLNLRGPQPYKYETTSWDHIEPYVPEVNVSYDVLFDSHSHTKYSDGVLTVEQNIRWHISMGFNAIAITDHNNLKNSADLAELAEAYKDQIIVIQGMEWTTNRIHMNFIGISEWELKIPGEPTDLEIQQAIDEVHNQGGVVSVNHYVGTARKGDNVPSMEQLIEWDVDYFEVVNEDEYYEEIYSFWANNTDDFSLITGTDMHKPDDVFGWNAMNVSSFTETAVMNQLRNHNTTVIYDQNGAEDEGDYGRNAAYTALRPFYDFGGTLSDYYEGLGHFDPVSLVVFFTYYFGIFVLFEIIIHRDQIWRNIKEKRITDSVKKED